MRLNQNQINYFKKLSLDIFNSSDIYLFGSRTDDSLKGGDIDIYIQTEQKENILKSKLIFLREFEKEFGEQKIDLIIDNQSNQKEIFEIAKKGIRL
ncbi:MAG: nucleotidyltransferase domain-containing protein [Epsilonproteobacteria bacterium]|nr:MAG: nucleotidyltransferase domain-containing protein [Campylobacterota bacterium]